jgi:hypothetical protein
LTKEIEVEEEEEEEKKKKNGLMFARQIHQY